MTTDYLISMRLKLGMNIQTIRYLLKHQEFKRTLNLCIAFIYAIAELLENFQDRFNIVLSVNDDDFVVKFYCVRGSEG